MQRRQIIIVTHNANLIVNTDADQVIVASCGPHRAGELPVISYIAGGLEDPRIRASVHSGRWGASVQGTGETASRPPLGWRYGDPSLRLRRGNLRKKLVEIFNLFERRLERSGRDRVRNASRRTVPCPARCG
jgi:hypothetical protein